MCSVRGRTRNPPMHLRGMKRHSRRMTTITMIGDAKRACIVSSAESPGEASITDLSILLDGKIAEERKVLEAEREALEAELKAK